MTDMLEKNTMTLKLYRKLYINKILLRLKSNKKDLRTFKKWLTKS